MDIVKTLQSLEEAVYEIVTWVLFLPKTFFKVVIRPDWIQGYVSAEFEKEPDKRFQGFLSPILFWLIVAVVPYAVSSVKVELTGSVLTVGDLNTSVLVLNTLLLMTIPALSAFALLRFKKLPLEREPLKRLLYMQCYPAAIFELFALPILVLVAVPNNLAHSAMVTTTQTIFGVFGVWFLVAEVIVFKQELEISWFNATLRAIITVSLSTILLLVVTALYALFLVATGVIPMPGG